MIKLYIFAKRVSIPQMTFEDCFFCRLFFIFYTCVKTQGFADIMCVYMRICKK